MQTQVLEPLPLLFTQIEYILGIHLQGRKNQGGILVMPVPPVVGICDRSIRQ